MKKVKIIKVILSVILCFIICIGVGLYLSVSSVNSIEKVYPSREITIGKGEKKALLIYEPSKSKLSENVSLKVTDIMQNNGYSVTINYPSDELEYDLNDYDTIVFASPVYAHKISPVLEKYIKDNPIENKKIILYTLGKLENKSDLDKLKECVSKNNTIYAEKYTDSTEDSFYDFIENSCKSF